MASGGYRLEFATVEDAERAYMTAAEAARERVDRLLLREGSAELGTWSVGLVREDRTLSVATSSTIRALEYDIRKTPQGESLFQLICMRLAFFYPSMRFTGSCTYRTGKSPLWTYGTQARDFAGEQTIVATYEGGVLTFEVIFVAEGTQGRDAVEQRQVWMRNDYGFFVREAMQVLRFEAGADPVDLRRLSIAEENNPYLDNAAFFLELDRALEGMDLSCSGMTSEGYAFGCAMVEDVRTGCIPAVCLNDPRGRELWVSCAPDGERVQGLPRWVRASPQGELLAWQMGDGRYLWDGLRVRRIAG